MSTITTPDNLKKPEIELVGADGDAFSVMGIAVRALKDEGNDPEVIEAYQAEAMNGDYNHLLQTTMTYCEVVG